MDLSEYAGQLAGGLVVSLELTLISVVLGYAIGLGLALLVVSKNPIVKWGSLCVVEFGRGIPALVVIYLAYYGLASIHVLLDSFVAAAIALTFTVAAYSSEIIRGGLSSVPRGQREASIALGHSRSTQFLQVVLPQGLRAAVPPLISFSVQSFQATSLAYSIAVSELMSQAYQISTVTFNYMSTYAITGLIYAAVAVPAIWLSRALERRLARGQA